MDQTNEARLLLELFNSNRNNNTNNNTSTIQQSHTLPNNNSNNITNNNNNNSSSTLGDQRTTQEDLKFLKLANEVIQSSDLKSKIDPTISTLLQRAQYFASPHGGLPINNLVYSRSSSSSNDHQPQTFPDLSLNEFKPKLQHQQRQEPQQQQQQQQEEEEEIRGDEKPFICSKCLLSFRRSSDLKRHEKTHLEVLPNICKLCHKGFARKDALKRHIETLTCRRNRERLLQSLGITNNENEKDVDLDIILQKNGVNEY